MPKSGSPMRCGGSFRRPWPASSFFVAGSARRLVRPQFGNICLRQCGQEQLTLITGGNHQDPPTTVLLYGRMAHPLGTPPHPASSPTLALGESVQWRLGTIARPSISCLTAPLAPDPPIRLLNGLGGSRQVGPRVSLAACCPDNLPQHRHRGPPTSLLRGYRTLHSGKSIGTKPSRLFPLPPIPCLTGMATSLRWIRAYTATQSSNSRTSSRIEPKARRACLAVTADRAR